MEKIVSNDIMIEVCDKLKNRIDDIVDVEIEPREDGGFEFTSSLVLCNANDIITKSQIQAQLMRDFGLDQEDIDKVLEVQVISMNGF
jgi:hypothetical protein